MADPVFLITGASSGIGAATARRAAEEGYRLVLAARSKDKVESLAGELGGPERALAVGCDVSEWDQQQSMVEKALETFGSIDVAFANAGIGGVPGGFSGADPDGWRNMILTNVYGAGLTARACLEALKESRGHLLFTGSTAGRRVLSGSMYSCTKWAVTGDGRGREAGSKRHRHTGHRYRTRHGRYPRSSTPRSPTPSKPTTWPEP